MSNRVSAPSSPSWDKRGSGGVTLLKLKANFKVTPSIPLNPRGKFSGFYVLKGEFTYIFVADP